MTHYHRFILLGADSDVACRYVFPALAQLESAKLLPSNFRIVGVTRKTWSRPDDFRHHIEKRVKERGGGSNKLGALKKLLVRVSHSTADLSDARQLQRVVEGGKEPVVLYFGLPPPVTETIVRHLPDVPLPPHSRVMMEKPFGHDLDSAKELNRRLHKLFPEHDIFRVDHFLGKQTVQNILGLRFANRILESAWDHQHIARIEIVWEEMNALEGRAGYYDTAGALKDMIQNHLVQLMCFLAMEPPSKLSESELRDRKTELLKSIRHFSTSDIERHTARGRYTAGRRNGRSIRAYVDEPGVDPNRQTETFAEVRLFVDNQRWRDVPFVLRTGKAMKEDRQEINVIYKSPRYSTFLSSPSLRVNRLRLGLQTDRVGLTVNVNGPGNPLEADAVELNTELAPEPMSAYASLILDVLKGDSIFFIRNDEAEEAWKVMDPIEAGWKRSLVPLQPYRAGSRGIPPL